MKKLVASFLLALVVSSFIAPAAFAKSKSAPASDHTSRIGYMGIIGFEGFTD